MFIDQNEWEILWIEAENEMITLRLFSFQKQMI